MIKFIEHKEENNIPFSSVEENQFFVNLSGELCQKSSTCCYIVIADSENNPYALRRDCYEHEIITRKLPKVEKIEF